MSFVALLNQKLVGLKEEVHAGLALVRPIVESAANAIDPLSEQLPGPAGKAAEVGEESLRAIATLLKQVDEFVSALEVTPVPTSTPPTTETPDAA